MHNGSCLLIGDGQFSFGAWENRTIRGCGHYVSFCPLRDEGTYVSLAVIASSDSSYQYTLTFACCMLFLSPCAVLKPIALVAGIL